MLTTSLNFSRLGDLNSGPECDVAFEQLTHQNNETRY